MISPAVAFFAVLAVHPFTAPAAPTVATPSVLAAPDHTQDPVPGRCDPGRTPISAPLTITQPGSYYLTTDVASAEGSAIKILAHDVTRDLNGHRVSAPITDGVDAILIEGDAQEVFIRNGRIFGGHSPLHARTTNGRVNLKLEDVDIRNPNVDLPVAGKPTGIVVEGAGRIEILNSSIEVPLDGIHISGGFYFRLSHSHVHTTWSGTTVSLDGVIAGVVEDNRKRAPENLR